MKNKILLSFVGLALFMGLTSGKAEATTKRSAKVYNSGANGNLENIAGIKTGDYVRGSDGRLYLYVKNGDEKNISGSGYVIKSWNGHTYVYGFVTYNDGKNAANETRMIAQNTATAESTVLSERIEDRISAAHLEQAPNQPGVFALGNGGMNAGNQPTKAGVWAMYGYSNIKNTGGVENFKANLHSGTMGVDYLFNPCFLAGVAFSYGRINDGKYSIRNGRYEHDSYTGAIYASLIAHQYVTFDAMIGYGKVHKKYKEKATNIVAGVVNVLDNGPDLAGRTQSRRFLGNIFANGRYSIDKLNLWLRVGYAHVNDKEDSFTLADSTNQLASKSVTGGTINIGNLSGRLRAGYRFHEMVEPYLQGGGNYNVVRTKLSSNKGPSVSDKRFGWMIGGGFRVFPMDSLTGGVQYTFNRRGKLTVHNATVDVRYNF